MSLKETDKRKSYFEAKHDDGKPDFTLVPMAIVRAVQKVRAFGCKKYDRENWKTVPDAMPRYHRAFLRHVIAAWNDPWKTDPESGLPHLYHAACNLAFMFQLKEWEDGRMETVHTKEQRADSKTV